MGSGRCRFSLLLLLLVDEEALGAHAMRRRHADGCARGAESGSLTSICVGMAAAGCCGVGMGFCLFFFFLFLSRCCSGKKATLARPSKAVQSVVLAKHLRSGSSRGARTIRALTEKSFLRADLTPFAITRYHKLRKATTVRTQTRSANRAEQRGTVARFARGVGSGRRMVLLGRFVASGSCGCSLDFFSSVIRARDYFPFSVRSRVLTSRAAGGFFIRVCFAAGRRCHQAGPPPLSQDRRLNSLLLGQWRADGATGLPTRRCRWRGPHRCSVRPANDRAQSYDGSSLICTYSVTVSSFHLSPVARIVALRLL